MHLDAFTLKGSGSTLTLNTCSISVASFSHKNIYLFMAVKAQWPTLPGLNKVHIMYLERRSLPYSNRKVWPCVL